jgi:hypothetical protein
MENHFQFSEFMHVTLYHIPQSKWLIAKKSEQMIKYLKFCVIKLNGALHHWLMPTILATQEAEIWRIVVWGQPEQISSQGPILKNLITK